MVSMVNSMATLGAVTEEKGKYFVGSRLTVYEGEDAWNVQFGLNRIIRRGPSPRDLQLVDRVLVDLIER